MELPTDKQVEIYDLLDARHTVTDKGVDNLSWEQILEMSNIIKRCIMKELSIEQKAKRYDEALKVLHKYDGANIMFSQSLKEEMFPELKESEDERIRRVLREIVLQWKNGHQAWCSDDKEIDTILAWLEKQGERKTWSEEDEHRLKDTIYFLDTAKKHYASTVELDACINWLKSLKDKYTWKPSDEQIGVIESLIENRSIQRRHLVSLYEQLKKLKGE